MTPEQQNDLNKRLLQACLALNAKPDDIKTLLDKGADPNAKAQIETIEGWTLLYLKALYNRENAARLKSSDPSAEIIAELPPLFIAAFYGREDIARLLLDAGSSPHAKSENGKTPLHLAQNENVARLLLAAGAGPNAKDDKGLTPLHWAAAVGNEDIAKLLLAKGAEPDAKNHDGQTPADLTEEPALKARLAAARCSIEAKELDAEASEPAKIAKRRRV
jgi:cytohesin